MKTEIHTPEITFPCLCIWTGGVNLTDKQIKDTVKPSDVMIAFNDGKEILLQYANANKRGWRTENFEHDYQILPKGFEVKLTQ